MIDKNEKLNEALEETIFKFIKKNDVFELFSKFKEENDLEPSITFNKKSTHSFDLKKSLRGKSLTDEEMNNIIREAVKKAGWLRTENTFWIKVNPDEVIEFLTSFYKSDEGKKLSQLNFIKLVGIILSIPFAEKAQDKEGVIQNFVYEHLLKMKSEVTKYFDSSISAWQIPVSRLNDLIKKKEISKKEKKEFYNNPSVPKALNIVTKIILDIGIDKPLEAIFTDYNRVRRLSSYFAAVEFLLNYLRELAELMLNEKKADVEILALLSKRIAENNPKEIIWLTKKEHDILKSFADSLIKKRKHILEGKKDLSEWPKIETLSGVVGSGFLKTLKKANEFFEFIDGKEDKEILDELDKLKGESDYINQQKIYYLLKRYLTNVNLDKLTVVPTSTANAEIFEVRNRLFEKIIHSMTENHYSFYEALEKHLKEETKLHKDFVKFVSDLKEETDTFNDFLKLDKKKRKFHLISYFRRRSMNPFDTDAYVKNALIAFSNLLKNIIDFN